MCTFKTPSVRTFKTFPCAPAPRPLGDVLNVHTGFFQRVIPHATTPHTERETKKQPRNTHTHINLMPPKTVNYVLCVS